MLKSRARARATHEIWKVPAKDLSVEQLVLKLEGPLEADKIGPFGGTFLEKRKTRFSNTGTAKIENTTHC